MTWRLIRSPLMEMTETQPRGPKANRYVHGIKGAQGIGIEIPHLPNPDDTIRRDRVTIDRAGRYRFDDVIVVCHTFNTVPDWTAMEADDDCEDLAEAADLRALKRALLRGRPLDEVSLEDARIEKARLLWRRKGTY